MKLASDSIMEPSCCLATFSNNNTREQFPINNLNLNFSFEIYEISFFKLIGRATCHSWPRPAKYVIDFAY
jgi:hypothetical protein